MFGGGSIQLVRVFGVRIGVDISWFFVFFLVIYSLSGYYGDLFPNEETKTFALAVASALLFFLSVVLHELGHALEAKRSGIGIAGIDLWLFGGVAKMERDTRSAGEEFRVAVAGPLVTLAIAGACFLAVMAVEGSGQAARSTFFDTEPVGELSAMLGYLAFVNTALLIFNLIPGFPLDGGRIARAIAWWRTGDRTRATRFAARLGRLFSFLMIGFGIFLFLAGSLVGGIWLVFVGMFLGSAARQSEHQTEVQSRIEGIQVSDVMDAEPIAMPAELPLDRAYDEFFLRFGWPWFPVVDEAGRLVGVVTREAVESIPDAARAGRAVASAMAADADDSTLRVRLDEPLEALLGREGLARLGAIMAVDAEGVLRGVVTVDRVRQALRPVGP